MESKLESWLSTETTYKPSEENIHDQLDITLGHFIVDELDAVMKTMKSCKFK